MNQTEKLKAQLVIVIGFIALFFIFKSDYLLYAAFFLGIIFLFVSPLGNLIIKLWFKLAEILGWLNSRILLSIVFYVFLFPLAAINKLFSKNALHLKNVSDTLFTERNHKYKKDDLENVW